MADLPVRPADLASLAALFGPRQPATHTLATPAGVRSGRSRGRMSACSSSAGTTTAKRCSPTRVSVTRTWNTPPRRHCGRALVLAVP